MKKLSKADIAHRERLSTQVQTAWQALVDGVDDFNAALAEAWGDLETLQDAYNAAREEMVAWQNEMASDMQTYVEARSEKWQDSAAGEAYTAWMRPYADEELLEESALECPEELRVEAVEPESVLEELTDAPE